MTMPRLDDASRAYFHDILPDDPRVTVRPMFGALAAFVNGHMFSGVFGSGVFVRLSEADRAELLAVPGTDVFAPIAGRGMKEYVTLPEGWREDQDLARAWLLRSLHWAATLPVKEPKKKPRRGSEPVR